MYLECKIMGPVPDDTKPLLMLGVACVLTENHGMTRENIRNECQMFPHMQSFVKHLDHLKLYRRKRLRVVAGVDTAEIGGYGCLYGEGRCWR